MKAFLIVKSVTAAAVAALPALAQTTSPNGLAQSDTVETQQIASQFVQFAGSEQNAEALLTGIRTGMQITLVSPTTGQTATFTPANAQPNFADAFVALSLAQQLLTRAGVTTPAPADIEAALNGGTLPANGTATTTAMQGVLQMRASGMQWNQISSSAGLSLGPVLAAWGSMQARMPPGGVGGRQAPGSRLVPVGQPPGSRGALPPPPGNTNPNSPYNNPGMNPTATPLNPGNAPSASTPGQQGTRPAGGPTP